MFYIVFLLQILYCVTVTCNQAIPLAFERINLLTLLVKCCVRPEYAPESSDEEEEEEVEFSMTKQQQPVKVTTDADHETKLEAERDDRRLRRLHDRQQDDVDSDEDREARSVAFVALSISRVGC